MFSKSHLLIGAAMASTITGPLLVPEKPGPGENSHRPRSGSHPVSGGGARERTRNLARMGKQQTKISMGEVQ